MNTLELTYERDDVRNSSGILTASVDAGGFHGHVRTYAAEAWIAGFAHRLGTYPLAETGATLSGMREVTINVAPLNSRGHLRVSVALSSGEETTARQQANLQIITDYAGIEEFRLAMLAMSAGISAKATLRAHY